VLAPDDPPYRGVQLPVEHWKVVVYRLGGQPRAKAFVLTQDLDGIEGAVPDFLDDFDTELIDNGHIELGVYVRDKRATLRLTEHKTVVWIAEDDAMASDVAAWLRALEVPHLESLVRVASVPHFHWRGAKTRGRKKLGDELFKQRLRRVDKVAMVTGPREPD
jgi:hypothetical protein